LANDLKRKYEAMFLVDSAEATAKWDDVLAAINTVMERAEASVLSLQKWDERRLAYEIAGRKRGMYILCYFEAVPAKISSIERDVQLSESLLRVLILSADVIPEAVISIPTPAMVREEAERKAAEQTQRATEEQARRDREDQARRDSEDQGRQAAEEQAVITAVSEDAGADTKPDYPVPSVLDKANEPDNDRPEAPKEADVSERETLGKKSPVSLGDETAVPGDGSDTNATEEAEKKED